MPPIAHATIGDLEWGQSMAQSAANLIRNRNIRTRLKTPTP
jgi:hypothetical protein